MDDSSILGQASHYALDDVGQASSLPLSSDRQAASLPHNHAAYDDTPPEFAGEAPKKSKRRQTAHLKLVPQSKELRERLAAKAAEVAAKLDKSRPLTKDEMEKVVRRTLEECGQPEGYVGWMMVILASEFWKDQVAAVPPSRRLFLLPHCLKHAEGCPADYDEFGLECKKCGACSIADFRGLADEMGYKVLVAEGSPIVLKIIVSGYVDAIVGVACLNVLEKAIDKILLAGIPCMAVPLLSSDCRNTSVDDDWVMRMIKLQADQAAPQTRTYVHLLRAASNLFKPEELDRLVPRVRSKVEGQRSKVESSPTFDIRHSTFDISGSDPIAATEAIAYDFLAKGGKYSRPFITLAVYDALTGGHGTKGNGTSGSGAEHVARYSDSVRRAAMSIETFHKASLVHDDIEDDDPFRYGEETIHKKFGVPTAINVGDYLIGMGYRLISRESKTLGSDVVADIVDCLADAHLRLSEGQGAELLWRDAHDKRLKPLDALKIYALKTAPAFEAALFSGARLAGPIDKYIEPIKQFARNLGVAFQIINDLADWDGDDHNKLASGGDILGGRPTVLWALALDGLSPAKQEELLAIVAGTLRVPLADGTRSVPTTLSRVRQLYDEAGVFDKAQRLIEKHQERAEKIADEIEPEELRALLYYLIDSVLDRVSDVARPAAQPVVLSSIA
ncbi:MAG: polyprenyl synthetase family protein [Planctomycetaceae bacterium]|nr:polyprenyl synthetase family protein [Planctomycetaceae bacterium]